MTLSRYQTCYHRHGFVCVITVCVLRWTGRSSDTIRASVMPFNEIHKHLRVAESLPKEKKCLYRAYGRL